MRVLLNNYRQATSTTAEMKETLKTKYMKRIALIIDLTLIVILLATA